MYISANVPTGASGVQIVVYNTSGKKVAAKTGYSSATFSLKKNYGYKYRMRAYYTNTEQNKTYYGKWSAYKYFAAPTVTGKATSATKGFTLTLKKGTGLKGYIVYVSKSRDSGYKKTTVIRPTAKSVTTRIRKIGSASLKGKTTYYVKIIPMVKKGSSYVKSQITNIGSIYVYKN